MYIAARFNRNCFDNYCKKLAYENLFEFTDSVPFAQGHFHQSYVITSPK